MPQIDAPKRIRVLQIRWRVTFPSTKITLALGGFSNKDLEKLKTLSHLLLIPTWEEKANGKTRRFLSTTGVLSKILAVRKQSRSKDGPKRPFVDLDNLARVIIKNQQNQEGGSNMDAEWKELPDEPLNPKFLEDQGLKTNLEALKDTFMQMYQLVKGLSQEKIWQDFETTPLARETLEAVDILSPVTLGPTLNKIMGFLNYLDIEGLHLGINQKLFFTRSLNALAERNVLKRLLVVVNILYVMATGQKLHASQNILNSHIADYEEQYEKIKDKMSEEARKEAERELARLGRNGHSTEMNMVEEHLYLILNLPWGIYTEDTRDLREVRRILDEDHAGLDKIKERILESIAVRQLNPTAKSPILCFVGPPGVGKTSLGKSIARALGRKFTRLSLGGLKDEADIRGHRGTYINSMPGNIIDAIRKCGSANSVFMLDEIDKVGKSWNGDPSAALLEVLDPEQNFAFLDHYLKVHFDLSRIFFIVTANILETILPALEDRLEIIEIPGYTPLEKVRIAQLHLIKHRRVENGFPVIRADRETIDVVFDDDAIFKLIYQYTREAGVRNLERALDSAFRKVAKQIQSQEDIGGVIRIAEQNLQQYCGRQMIIRHTFPNILPCGVVPVLTVSNTGGEVFAVEVEVSRHPGRRKITMAGVLKSGDPKDATNKITESFRNGFDSLTGIGGILFETLRELEERHGTLLITGNITNGSTPKDGPSAGIAFILAIYGALRGKSIKPTPETPLLGVTGEISIKLDDVTVIGGMRDKILAAHRAGIRRLILSKDNEPDLEDVPPEILGDITVKTVRSKWEALIYAYPEDEEFIRNYLARRQQGS